MKGGNTYDDTIDPIIVKAVTEYVKSHKVTGKELVMEVSKTILPDIPLSAKRNAICQMRLQGIVKFDGFRCSV